MSSFTLQRNINNFPIKKTVNFSSTPSVNNNSQSLGSTGSVSSASINILTLNGTQVTATGDKLNYVDVTPGTAAASKALVLNSSRDISNINSLSCTSLTVNGTAITGSSTPTELTGITAGTASASKALVLDASRDISNINSLSCTSLTVNGTAITGTPSELTGITAGTASASKALVLDASRDISNINNLSSSKLTINPNTPSSVLLTNWTTNITPATSSSLQQITYSPELSLFVIVHNTNNTTTGVMTSTDGITWTSRTTGSSATWNCVYWCAELNLFILGGNGGKMAYSSNGTTWTQVSSGSSSAIISAIIWYPKFNQLVAINSAEWGDANDGLFYSSTGRSWSLSKKASTWHYETCMAYSPELGLLVTTGTPLSLSVYYSYFMYTTSELSTSIITSNMIANPTNHANIYINWRSICWSSYLGMFVAVADASSSVTSKIAYSTNGTSWTLINSPSTNNWSKVLWCDKINIFVAISSDSTSALMTSPNGITWTLTNSLPSTSGLTDMYWDSNNLQLIMISNNTTAMQKILITKYTISNNGLSLNINSLTGNITNSELISDVNMNYLVSQGGNHIFYSKSNNNNNKQLVNIQANGYIGINNVSNPTSPLDIQTISNRAITIRSSTTNSAYSYFMMDNTGTLTIRTKTNSGSNGLLDLSKQTIVGPLTVNNSVTISTGSLTVSTGSITTNTSSSLKCGPTTTLGVNKTAITDYALQLKPNLDTNANPAGLVFRMMNSNNSEFNAIGLMPFASSRTDGNETTGLRFIRIRNGTAIGDSTNSPFSILATGGCQSSNQSGGTIHSFRCESETSGASGNISFEGTSSTWARIKATKSGSNSGFLELICTDSGIERTCLTINPNSSGGNLTSINNITYAGTLTGPSDIRLKENIEDADLDLCYNNMKTLKLKKYQWKEGINHLDNKKIGWIAQDVEQIFPKSIIETPMYDLEDCKTIGTDQIMATMYGTIQKLMQKVEKLEEFINTLEIE